MSDTGYFGPLGALCLAFETSNEIMNVDCNFQCPNLIITTINSYCKCKEFITNFMSTTVLRHTDEVQTPPV